MTTTDTNEEFVDFDVQTLVVTTEGEPTQAIRDLLAQDGWVILPSTELGTVRLLPEPSGLTLIVPLLDEAKALVGKDVVVWIPGGMQADGTLTEVDEDQQTLVVIDGRRRYAIALQSIALIESAR